MPRWRKTQRLFSLAEVVQQFMNDPDTQVQNVVVLPPENQGQVTDEEEETDGTTLPTDVPGEVEVDFIPADGESSADNSDSEDTVTAPLAHNSRKNKNKKQKLSEWNERDTFENPIPETSASVENLENLREKNPFELFQLFYTDEMNTMLVNQSMAYAKQHNNHGFQVSEEEMAKFTGMHVFSGYHTLPRQRLYWSADEDVVIPLVSRVMTRNRFEAIKYNLHLADNEHLDIADKSAKVRPLFEMLNRNLRQFGVFKSDLSADEQMLPYYGKHSAKMYMRNKPVKFGYKFWVLASSTGYPFQITLYSGKDKTSGARDPLGSKVIHNLLAVIEHPEHHTVTFDNFFSSLHLFRQLKERGIRATGTIRENRLRECPIARATSMKNDDRGSFYYQGDGDIVVAAWKDNKPVYVASNYLGVSPVAYKKRYSRADKKHVQVRCPNMIDGYNRTMGGVDILDRFLSQYRPTMTGKKWWYCFYTHAINICTVAAWRIHCEVGGKMDQLEFLRYVVRTLLQGSFRHTSVLPRDVIASVRFDEDGHNLVKAPMQGRCKLKGCGTHTYYMCQKCSQRLHQKCFDRFHLQTGQ